MLSHSPIRLPGLLTQIKYVEGGERAVAAFDAGVAGYEARAFRGMGVFVSTPYEVSDDADSVQMLQRSSQVGEFYRMAPPPVPKVSASTGKMVPEYMGKPPPARHACDACLARLSDAAPAFLDAHIHYSPTLLFGRHHGL